MFSTSWWTSLVNIFAGSQLLLLLQALITVGIGWALARILDKALLRAFRTSPNKHQTMLIRRGTYYLVLSLFSLAALSELGLSLSIFLGTAGVLTVAVGFASQTSMSNLISGLFLIGEKPFAINDVIKIGSTTGIVMSIDLLSVKLRTFDNTYVRVPNEMLIKSQVTTLTKFPIRRIDIKFKVDYNEDISQVRAVLFAVADKNPLSLVEPAPVFIFQGFHEVGMEIQFSVWTQREQYLTVLNSLYEEIKIAFDEANIKIALPHRTLTMGMMDEPVPLQIVPR